MAKNYYDILGISKTASADEIRRAYRKLAGEHHPDRGGKAESFKEINEAYQVLSDNAKRSQYDQYGSTFEQAQRQGGFGGAGFGGAGNPFGGFDFSGAGFGNGPGGFGGNGVEFDLGDIFSDIFGGPQAREQRRNRGVDLEMPLSISFEEAAFGVEKEITLEKKNKCQKCEGKGAEPGSKIITCPKCHGQGQIRTSRRTMFGNIQSAEVCDRCEGTGKIPETPCTECKGSGVKRGAKTIKVKIPAGIDNGQRIRVTGEGEAGYRGSENGDLYIVIEFAASREFVRQGFDLYKNENISFTQAALGTTINVSTLDGETKIKIPAGTQPGLTFRVAGKGIQHLNRSGRGDLFVKVNVVVPKKLSKKQKELLKELEEIEN
jgi:molecular chaperone DnaJ